MRAPWRWRWGAILALLLRAGAWSLVIWWAPVLAIALAGWLVLWLKSHDPHPLPRPEPEGVVTIIHAGHRVEKRFNGAQTTVTPEAVRAQRVQGG